jgi:hypothetical protein
MEQSRREHAGTRQCLTTAAVFAGTSEPAKAYCRALTKHKRQHQPHQQPMNLTLTTPPETPTVLKDTALRNTAASIPRYGKAAVAVTHVRAAHCKCYRIASNIFTAADRGKLSKHSAHSDTVPTHHTAHQQMRCTRIAHRLKAYCADVLLLCRAQKLLETSTTPTPRSNVHAACLDTSRYLRSARYRSSHPR